MRCLHLDGKSFRHLLEITSVSPLLETLRELSDISAPLKAKLERLLALSWMQDSLARGRMTVQ